MGYAGKSSPHVIIWMGVLPGSLSVTDGIEVAIHSKTILSAFSIDDVRVEIRESEVTRSAKMYKPALEYNTTARIQGPFSTALGLPICAQATPCIQGTGGFFISDPRDPGRLYLVTARHVVFPPNEDNDKLYQHNNSGQHCRNVLPLGDATLEEHVMDIESKICLLKRIIIEDLEDQLKAAEWTDGEDAEAERNRVLSRLEEGKEALEAYEGFLKDISRDWAKQEDCVLGHVTLSPPIGLNVGEEGFTEDWAVIKVDNSKIDKTNFVGNAIDLGTTIPFGKFTARMRTYPPPFNNPGNRLLEFYGTISDDEMWKPSLKTLKLHYNNDPCIMVIKGGPDLKVGLLNTIRSFTRYYFKGQPSQMSKEVSVLPRDHL